MKTFILTLGHKTITEIIRPTNVSILMVLDAKKIDHVIIKNSINISWSIIEKITTK
jgi:hypothetical protein